MCLRVLLAWSWNCEHPIKNQKAKFNIYKYLLVFTEVIYLAIYDFQSILQSGRKAFHKKGKWVTECIASSSLYLNNYISSLFYEIFFHTQTLSIRGCGSIEVQNNKNSCFQRLFNFIDDNALITAGKRSLWQPHNISFFYKIFFYKSERLRSSDRVLRSSDRVQSSSDRVQSSSDRVQSSSDRVQSSSDRVQSSSDRVQSSSDRVLRSSDCSALARC